jgi:probable phosphoglycerate mutase
VVVEEALDLLFDDQWREHGRMLRSMRRRLYLMRHAEVSYVGGHDPQLVRLTERGHEQAAAAHGALEHVAFDLVVTSSLPRTVETAEVVVPEADPEPWSAFDEWRGGRLDDVPREELEQLFVGALQVKDEQARFLGGESLGEALDRVLPAFHDLAGREWDTALAVLHGGVNRILLSHALTGDRTYFGTFEQAPACINVLDLGEDGAWIVRTVNYIPYDPLHPARTTTMEHLWSELEVWLDER